MKNITVLNTKCAGAFVGVALLLIGTLPATAAVHRAVLPIGTVIPVRLEQDLSSKTAHEGDRVTVTVRAGDDDAGFPEGTRIDGVIREVQPASDKNAGVLDIDFRHMNTPGGQSRDMSGSIISLDTKSIQRTESGRLTAKPDKSKERLKFIGMGAGAGLLIGSLTKKNELTTTVLGAAAGYLYNEFGKKPKPADVTLKAGTEFGIRMDREFVFQTSQADIDRTTVQNREYSTSTFESNDGAIDNDSGSTQSDLSAAISGSDTGVLVNNHNVKFDSELPFREQGIWFVPLNPVAKAAKLDYNYDTSEKTIRISNGKIRLGLNSRVALVDGERHLLSTSAQMRNGTLYVPASFIDLATGGTSFWDASSRTIVFTTD